jgi:hypothetical protein
VNLKTARFGVLILLAVALVAPAACAGAKAGQGISVPTKTITPAPQMPACASRTRGCAKDQMDQYLAGVYGQAWTNFLAAQLPHLGPPKVVYVPEHSSTLTCDGLFAEPELVGPDHTGVCGDKVHVGQSALFGHYQAGPLVPAMNLVSLLTLYIQNHSLARPNSASDKRRYLQSDCAAGAWLQDAIAHNLPGANDQAAAAYANYKPKKAVPNAPSKPEILGAITYGRSHGMSGCSNRYFPDAPLENAH